MTKSSKSRQQRRSQPAPVSETIGATAPPTSGMDDATTQRINDLISGKVSPPSQDSARYVERLKAAVAECESADRNLGGARAQIKQMETNFERLQGRASAFTELLKDALHDHDAQCAKKAQDALTKQDAAAA